MTKINIQKLKDSISIVEVIGNYAELKRVNGHTYKAKCPHPHHDDYNPSFFVREDKKFFKCFSCNFKGDVISFIEEMENVDFLKAVELLIENNGINYDEIETTDIIIKDNFSLDKLKNAIDLYNSEISIDEGILEKYDNTHRYLLERGFKKETLEHFEIGYCSDVNDRLYDRITFPWRDTNNRLVAINARTVSNKKPKYLFKSGSNKECTFYNLNNIRKSPEPIILVEGEKDVLRLWQLGYKRAVAIGGSDLGQRKWILRKHTSAVIMALDMDKPGLEARRKISEQLYPLMEVMSIKLPSNKDIADIKTKEEMDKIFNDVSVFKGGM